jgi:hypothetical protein
VVDKVALGQVFSQVPLSTLMASTVAYLPVIRGLYTGPTSGRRTKWAQSHPHTTN